MALKRAPQRETAALGGTGVGWGMEPTWVGAWAGVGLGGLWGVGKGSYMGGCMGASSMGGGIKVVPTLSGDDNGSKQI
jgi:hypothetical protein